MTTYTPNFHLDLYEGTDKPDLRNQYNGAINKVDTALQDLKTEDTTIQNLISSINAQLSTIQTDVDKVNADIQTLDTLTGQHTTQLTTLQTDVTALQSETSANSTNIMTQNEYFQALGVTSLQTAMDLKDDVNDAVSTGAANQADITTLKLNDQTMNTRLGNVENKAEANATGLTIANGDIDKLYKDVANLAQDWIILTDSTLYTNLTTNNTTVFYNNARTLFKVASNIEMNPGTLTLQQVPGTTEYGVKIANLSSVFPIPEEAVIYNRVAFRTFFTKNPSTITRFMGQTMVHATDGGLWYAFQSNANYPQGSEYSTVYINQPILTTKQYGFTPDPTTSLDA